jgi:hypothetical protein
MTTSPPPPWAAWPLQPVCCTDPAVPRPALLLLPLLPALLATPPLLLLALPPPTAARQLRALPPASHAVPTQLCAVNNAHCSGLLLASCLLTSGAPHARTSPPQLQPPTSLLPPVPSTSLPPPPSAPLAGCPDLRGWRVRSAASAAAWRRRMASCASQMSRLSCSRSP